MHEVIFTYQAELDYSEAFEFYDVRSNEVATRFQQTIEEALRIIQRDPLVWAKCDRRHRRYGVRDFPYSIYYHLTTNSILIVAIAHAKRRPNYWKE